MFLLEFWASTTVWRTVSCLAFVLLGMLTFNSWRTVFALLAQFHRSALSHCLPENAHNGIVEHVFIYGNHIWYNPASQNITFFNTMASPTSLQASHSSSHSALPPTQRTELRRYGGINALIAACNSDDRFKLLEDDAVRSGNLENPIHPVFSSLALDKTSNYIQAMRFASHLLTHESLLIFFIPLLYGRQLTTYMDGVERTYLSDPLANVSNQQQQEYLDGVREALHCLGHSTRIEFVPPLHRVYARTKRTSTKPAHTTKCCSRFQRMWSPCIEIVDYFKTYYEKGYSNASRCEQFRHDFLFAITLVHEIIHAFGVLQRGNLYEPYIRADDPNAEWGWAWENFMFGCIINPLQRSLPGTHLLMRKIWADDQAAKAAGGKEYYDVPMAWIAQWFREETWHIVAERGPAAIAPPTTHFKIQSSERLGSWIISSDLYDVKYDLLALHNLWKARGDNPSPTLPNKAYTPPVATSPPLPAVRSRLSRLLWRFQSTEKLQKSNVKIPVRERRRVMTCTGCGQFLPNMGQRTNSSTQQLTQDPQGLLISDEAMAECTYLCLCGPSCHTTARSRSGTPSSNASSKRSHDSDGAEDRSYKRRKTSI
ncbi:predicted protein [Plenodomus lingam JN3]|uniref:Predicted protein n=1 Tax=Leptosphaeria maculans (strain JN3 / isolate v23.1.3 / race Av1-4-5-6-7-8) TaxID=985895 RepID=E4ZZH5_LEPMJ|nr:predicted protein [Plenodomus lingam JN3]CBX96770.1 predicted protein [Plenodomus lingam JN3]